MKKLYTFSDASRKIGKNRNYFSNRYQLNPEYFDHNMVVVGGVKFLDEDGINAILGKIKKVVVLQKSSSFLKDQRNTCTEYFFEDHFLIVI